MMKTALFIGRFQPFHKGHWWVVQHALEENDFLIIGIGSAEDNYLPDNPFTAGERWEMITAALDEKKIPRERYTLLPVRNINNYALWVDHVEKLVPPFEKVYTGSDIVATLFKDHGRHTVEKIELQEGISATGVRTMMLEGGDWEATVPRSVADYLKKIKGVERLRKIQ